MLEPCESVAHTDVRPWLLIVGLALLVPSAIVNVVILWRRTPKAGAQPNGSAQ